MVATNRMHFGLEFQVRLETTADGRLGGSGIGEVRPRNGCREQQGENSPHRQQMRTATAPT